MQKRNRLVVVSLVVLGIGGWIAGPSPAPAQCSMMSGGSGHDHGAEQSPVAKKRTTSARKQRESVDRLLADEQGRRILSDALLEDAEFMRAFLVRAMQVPEWRALASQDPSSRSMGDRPGVSKSEEKPAIVYTCPMHPEVKASGPGPCPKCGMALVRRNTGN